MQFKFLKTLLNRSLETCPLEIRTLILFSAHFVQTEFGTPVLDKLHGLVAAGAFIALCFFRVPKFLIWILLALTVSSLWFSSLLLHGTYLFAVVATVSFVLNSSRGFILRGGLFLAYFFAFFHKLNFDFVNPAVSCALRIYELYPSLSFLGTSALVPWLVLVMEGFMSFGLFFRRTSPYALIVAMLFHISLLPAAIFAMPLNLLSLAASFLPEQSPLVLRKMKIGFLILMLPFMVRKLAWAFSLPQLEFLFSDFVLSVSTTLVLLGFAYIVWVQRSGMLTVFSERKMRLWEGCLAGILIIWGLQPYLGLSTMQSFTMESNLRTGDRPNHFLFAHVPPLFHFQQDLLGWNEYVQLLKDCPPESIVQEPLPMAFSQSGLVPFGKFEYIPRFQAQNLLLICEGKPLGVRRFLHFRASEAPSQCRN